MANYNRYSDRIIGKIIIQAQLKNTSPVLMGKPGGDETDKEVMCLPDGTPYLPASSLAGCLKRLLKSKQAVYASNITKEFIWGTEENIDANRNKRKLYQSHVIIYDAVGEAGAGKKIVRRDGVEIDPKTGIVKANENNTGNKFDYQVLEPEVAFKFKVEITIRESMKSEMDAIKRVAGWISKVVKDELRIGAFTNTGFGKMKGLETKAVHFDFKPKDKEHASKWFQYCIDEQLPDSLKIIPDAENSNNIDSVFKMEATFSIKSTLLIGAYGIQAEDPDKSHLKSNGMPVLTGKSIRGAIRHRALKILNTLNIGEDKLDSMMGYVKEPRQNGTQNENKKQRPQSLKGRLRIEEFIIKNVDDKQVQNRIKIDRFTGGTISGALFNTQPVWKKNCSENVTITFTLLGYNDSHQWEAALLLHLLKDIWTEDLAIGGEKNIGRGILTGQSALINFQGKEVFIKKGKDKSSVLFERGSIEDLMPFNGSLNKYFQAMNP